MIQLSWIISLIASFGLGYYINRLSKRLMELEHEFKQKKLEQSKTPEQKEAEKSTLIDPDDIVQQAKFEHEETMRQLNPQAYPDDQNE